MCQIRSLICAKTIPRRVSDASSFTRMFSFEYKSTMSGKECIEPSDLDISFISDTEFDAGENKSYYQNSLCIWIIINNSHGNFINISIWTIIINIFRKSIWNFLKFKVYILSYITYIRKITGFNIVWILWRQVFMLLMWISNQFIFEKRIISNSDL